MSKPTHNRPAHGRLLATASMTALLAAGWTAASAQTAPTPGSATANDTAVEEVVVTGIRQSLQSSVAMKKNTMEVVDSIRAEDIGKLPDPNVAETLTRCRACRATATAAKAPRRSASARA
jgi:iron complex outermembrane receptor protein